MKSCKIVDTAADHHITRQSLALTFKVTGPRSLIKLNGNLVHSAVQSICTKIHSYDNSPQLGRQVSSSLVQSKNGSIRNIPCVTSCQPVFRVSHIEYTSLNFAAHVITHSLPRQHAYGILLSQIWILVTSLFQIQSNLNLFISFSLFQFKLSYCKATTV